MARGFIIDIGGFNKLHLPPHCAASVTDIVSYGTVITSKYANGETQDEIVEGEPIRVAQSDLVIEDVMPSKSGEIVPVPA